MKRLEVRVLAIDPGDHVGYSTRNSSGQMSRRHFLQQYWNVMSHSPYERVVIERFDSRQLTADSEDTVKLIGALEEIALHFGAKVGWVNPSDKKFAQSYIDPDLVGDHARDAEAIRLWDLRYGQW